MSNSLILLIAATGKRCTFLKIFIKESNDLRMCVKIQLEDGKVLKEELIFIEGVIPKLLCYLSPRLMEWTHCVCVKWLHAVVQTGPKSAFS